MNAKSISLLVLLALAGCHKNHDGSPAGIGGLPGTCSPSAPKSYAGAVVQGSCLHPELFPPGFHCSTNYQFVTVQANVIDYPMDRISVTLTRADGSSVSIPSANIVLDKEQVGIVNGVEAGFTAYSINEQLCR